MINAEVHDCILSFAIRSISFCPIAYPSEINRCPNRPSRVTNNTCSIVAVLLISSSVSVHSFSTSGNARCAGAGASSLTSIIVSVFIAPPYFVVHRQEQEQRGRQPSQSRFAQRRGIQPPHIIQTAHSLRHRGY